MMFVKVMNRLGYYALGNVRVLGVFLISAALIIIVRNLGGIYVNGDSALQIEAAYRMVQGFGLTTTNFEIHSPNLNVVPIAPPLTWFPPGLSLMVASLLPLGLGLGIILKIIYTVVTIFGWVGWGNLGSFFLAKPIKIKSITLPTHLLLAGIFPVFYTPFWGGTDIFLWMITPYFVLCFYDFKKTNHFRELLGAALLLSLGVLFRYQGLFFGLAGIFILIQNHFRSPVKLMKYIASFLILAGIFISPILIWNRVNQVSYLPEYIKTDISVYDRIYEILISFIHLLNLLVFPVGIGQANNWVLVNFPDLRLFISLGWLVIIIIIPWWIFKSDKLDRDLGLSLFLVPLSIVVLLATAMLFNSYNFLALPRYYIPANPGLLFILYHFSTERSGFKLYKIMINLFLITFISYNLYSFTLPLRGKIENFSQLVIGYKITPRISYPNNGIYIAYTEIDSSYLIDSLRALRKLKEENPQALFYIQGQSIYAINFGKHDFRTIPRPDLWNKAYLSKATRIYWIVNSPHCLGICPSSNPDTETIGVLSRVPNLKLIFDFPDEHTKFYMADLPSGYRFNLGEK